jgi:hypothetical protein
MKIFTLAAAFVFCCGPGGAAVPKEGPVIVVPIGVSTPKRSPRMEAELARLKEQNAPWNLTSWTRLSEIPTWVSEKKAEPESAYLPGPPLAMDVFSHTVIIGHNRPTLVIRTGGFAGVYQIYQEAKKPNEEG